MADRVDIYIANNADWAGAFTLREGALDFVKDLTGATFEMDVRRTETDVNELATLTTGNGRVALSATPTDGRVFIMVPKSVAAALSPGRYAHDMIMTIGGEAERIWFGLFEVVQGTTR